MHTEKYSSIFQFFILPSDSSGGQYWYIGACIGFLQQACIEILRIFSGDYVTELVESVRICMYILYCITFFLKTSWPDLP
jgi:hypothetical protein